MCLLSLTYYQYNNRRSVRLFPLVLILLFLTSSACSVHNRWGKYGGGVLELKNLTYPELKILPGYVLEIKVLTDNLEYSTIFRSGFKEGDQYNYLVDRNGKISVPLLGEVNVHGKTIEETEGIIAEEVKEYLKDAFVSVNLAETSITVLGAVNNPGLYVLDEFANIHEALGVAGGYSSSADDQFIIIQRKSLEGIKSYLLNIRAIENKDSSLYFLHPEDVIMVRKKWIGLF